MAVPISFIQPISNGYILAMRRALFGTLAASKSRQAPRAIHEKEKIAGLLALRNSQSRCNGTLSASRAAMRN